MDHLCMVLVVFLHGLPNMSLSTGLLDSTLLYKRAFQTSDGAYITWKNTHTSKVFLVGWMFPLLLSHHFIPLSNSKVDLVAMWRLFMPGQSRNSGPRMCLSTTLEVQPCWAVDSGVSNQVRLDEVNPSLNGNERSSIAMSNPQSEIQVSRCQSMCVLPS